MLRQHMLASPLGLAPRPGETLPETVERGNQIRAKRRECQKLEVKLEKEIQFNRKVEINARYASAAPNWTDLERASDSKG